MTHEKHALLLYGDRLYLVMGERVVEQSRSVAGGCPVDPVPPPVSVCFVHPRLEKK